MKSKQQQNINAGLYYRLSKDDERAGEAVSIEDQKLMLRKFTAERGVTVIGEYVDDGWSGANFDRPEVKRLLEDAGTGRINVIIIKDISRLGRNILRWDFQCITSVSSLSVITWIRQTPKMPVWI